jgi:hypothetical protein
VFFLIRQVLIRQADRLWNFKSPVYPDQAGHTIMGKEPHQLRIRPAAVKYGILFLICGWLCHYAFYFTHFAEEMPSRTTYLQLAVGIGICYFVAILKRWARMMCLFFNLGIIALYALYCLAFFQSHQYNPMMMTGLIAVLFLISTYFLLKKETAQFFAAADPDVGRQKTSDN